MRMFKIVGFKLGVARPVFSKTVSIPDYLDSDVRDYVGTVLLKALMKSDFISIRWVEKKEAR